MKSGTLAKYIRENVGCPRRRIMTDDWKPTPGRRGRLELDRAKHKTINHSAGVYVDGEIGGAYPGIQETHSSLTFSVASVGSDARIPSNVG